MKRLLDICCCLLLALTFATPSHATEESLRYDLSVSFSDGTDATFTVTDDLHIAFTKNIMSIASASAYREVDVCDVSSLRYVESTSSIHNTLVGTNISLEGNSLIIKLQKESGIDVFSADGVLLRSCVPTAHHIISLDELHGLIVVKSEGVSFKFFIR